LDSEEVERATRDARALIHVARLGHRPARGQRAIRPKKSSGSRDGLGSELIFMGTRGRAPCIMR
jgi:hypothetical protein